MGLGWAAGEPLLVIGAAGIGAWILATQITAARAMIGLPDRLGVSMATEAERTAVDRELHVTLTVELPAPTEETLVVTAPLPPVAQGPERSERQLRIPPRETRAATAFTVSFPVAGRFAFPSPEVTILDRTGTYVETLSLGEAPTVSVEPPGPRDLHVGQGGEQVAAAYGEHAAERTGSGLTPVELRRYAPGDDISNIDWKATARLDAAHVREYETETDRRTALLVDQRATMNIGPSGATMFDYAREVALWCVRTAEEQRDPLSMYAVGGSGTTNEFRASSTPDHYRRIRDRLHDLEPIADGPTVGPNRTVGGSHARTWGLETILRGDDSAFADRLRPFLASTEAYVQRAESDPLYEAVRRQQARLSGNIWTLLVTDDSRRSETREVVRFATGADDYVLVFLTPRVLYRRGGFTDLERTYERYVQFEEFRRELTRLPRVTAFEVAPGERLGALLASRGGWEQSTTGARAR